MASTTIKIPTTPVTTRCENSMSTSVVISSGINCPLQPGQCRPQPIPLSVFVTSAPPSKRKSIPIVEETANHFKYLCDFKGYTYFSYNKNDESSAKLKLCLYF